MRFGEVGENLPVDLNSDGIIDIEDLALVAAALGEEVAALGEAAAEAGAAPPTTKGDIGTGHLQAAEVQQWIRDAKLANADPAGIAALEQLLAALSRRDLQGLDAPCPERDSPARQLSKSV